MVKKKKTAIEKATLNPPWKGLDQTPLPSLELNQQVKVIKGKHKGKKGNVIFYQTEGIGGRITLQLDNSKSIYVNNDEIDFKFEAISILLMCSEDERAEIQQKIKDMQDGNCCS